APRAPAARRRRGGRRAGVVAHRVPARAALHGGGQARGAGVAHRAGTGRRGRRRRSRPRRPPALLRALPAELRIRPHGSGDARDQRWRWRGGPRPRPRAPEFRQRRLRVPLPSRARVSRVARQPRRGCRRTHHRPRPACTWRRPALPGRRLAATALPPELTMLQTPAVIVVAAIVPALAYAMLLAALDARRPRPWRALL